MKKNYYLIQTPLKRISMKQTNKHILTAVIFFTVVIHNKIHSMENDIENDNETLTFVKVKNNNIEETKSFLRPFIQKDFNTSVDFKKLSIGTKIIYMLDQVIPTTIKPSKSEILDNFITKEDYTLSSKPMIIKKKEAIVGFIKIDNSFFYQLDEKGYDIKYQNIKISSIVTNLDHNYFLNQIKKHFFNMQPPSRNYKTDKLITRILIHVTSTLNHSFYFPRGTIKKNILIQHKFKTPSFGFFWYTLNHKDYKNLYPKNEKYKTE